MNKFIVLKNLVYGGRKETIIFLGKTISGLLSYKNGIGNGDPKKYTILKRSSESSGTSRTYTHLNQNTGEDFLEKVFRFYDSVFGVFRNMSSK